MADEDEELTEEEQPEEDYNFWEKFHRGLRKKMGIDPDDPASRQWVSGLGYVTGAGLTQLPIGKASGNLAEMGYDAVTGLGAEPPPAPLETNAGDIYEQNIMDAWRNAVVSIDPSTYTIEGGMPDVDALMAGDPSATPSGFNWDYRGDGNYDLVRQNNMGFANPSVITDYWTDLMIQQNPGMSPAEISQRLNTNFTDMGLNYGGDNYEVGKETLFGGHEPIDIIDSGEMTERVASGDPFETVAPPNTIPPFGDPNNPNTVEPTVNNNTTNQGGDNMANEEDIQEGQGETLEDWEWYQQQMLPLLLRQSGYEVITDDAGNRSIQPIEGYQSFQDKQLELSQSGMDAMLKFMEDNQMSDEAREALNEVTMLQATRQKKALAGELPISLATQQAEGDARARMEEGLSRQMGSGYETTTPGIQSLGEFTQRWETIKDQERRGEIATGASNLYGGLNVGNQLDSTRFGQNLAASQSPFNNAYANVPMGYQGLMGGYASAMQPYQFYSNLGQQAGMFNQQMSAQEDTALWGGIGALVGTIFGGDEEPWWSWWG